MHNCLYFFDIFLCRFKRSRFDLYFGQLVQRIEQAGQPTEWRVYRPIGVSSRCLICHGDVEQIPIDVQAVLELRYPQDRATGYTSNQWRGVIRISLEKLAPPTAK